MQFSEAFNEIIMLAKRHGVKRINELPACWEPTLPAPWKIAVNGHKEPVKSTSGVDVHPFTAYVEYNGWPAGVIQPDGGVIAAGECANKETFIAALRAA